MPNTRNTSEFFKDDYPAFGSYDNERKIASYIDGQKISMRKIIYTLVEKYPSREKTKTDTVANICAAFTNYLHGSQNLCSVCNNLTQAFVGANNYPLLEGNSSGFGTRINPTCAASRYTKVAVSPLVETLFNKDDWNIVERQYFEGSYIEPKFFIPIFPVLFLNGSQGLSTGFSQDIYPRNPEEIVDYLKAYMEGKKYCKELLPWFRGFKGSVIHNTETGKMECWGVVTKNNMTSYTITEIPIGIEYQKYIEILDKLCDDNTIVDYEDRCDTKTDEICFEIKTTREFTKKHPTDEKVYLAFKLIKNLPETLCCIDETNKVKEYDCIETILNDFAEMRLKYYDIRKKYLINKINNKLELLESKLTFCKAVINNEIIISNKKKDDIIQQIQKFETIKEVEGSYNYLLNMPIHSISYETVKSLADDIKKLKDNRKEIKATSIQEMWTKDLDAFLNKIRGN